MTKSEDGCHNIVNPVIATTNKTKQNKAKQLLLGGCIIGKKTITSRQPSKLIENLEIIVYVLNEALQTGC